MSFYKQMWNNNMKRNGIINLILGLILLSASCTYYTKEIFIPPVAEEKPTLEAAYVTTPPNSLGASFWSTADYVKISVTDQLKEQLAAEAGLLNVHGTYNGISDFNGGDLSSLVLKAAYDNENLYILASWNDKTINASDGNWIFNGPKDPLKIEDTVGWTSQRSSDNIIFAFKNEGNSKDVWKWSLAISEPIGFAIDMNDPGTGWVPDDGDKVFVRNAAGDDPYRSGPKYEWNGMAQELARDPGGNTILDPGYWLLNKSEFTADILNGDAKFQQNCSVCHGKNGEGHAIIDPEAPALLEPGKYNRFTAEALNSTLSDSSAHAGYVFWERLSDTDKTDVVARLKAFSGIPGYYLQNPSGSSADVHTVSGTNLAKVNYGTTNSGYKVLFIRKLKTGFSDDIQFDLTKSRQYEFEIYLQDNDNTNMVGAVSKELTFK
jgi:mono/diheme cytochrome c family protein